MLYASRIIGCAALLACVGNEAFAQVMRSETPLQSALVFTPPPNDIDVVDGDTLWIGIHQLRLFGVDALEPKQDCNAAGRSKDYCHTAAFAHLRALAMRPGFKCTIHTAKDGKPWISYGRYVATCSVGDLEVNRDMVIKGWAYADDDPPGNDYRASEAIAKGRRAGIHATEHKLPWEWRRQQRGDACVCEEE